MRGDSLRDLYAKTLALVGLGVLAGVGALFDYWPAGIRLVPAAPALELPELAASFNASISSAPPATRMAVRPPVSRTAQVEPAVVVTPELALISSPEPFAAPSETLPIVLSAAMYEPPAPLMTLAEHVPAEVIYGDAAATNIVSLTTDDEAGDSGPGSSWRDPITLVDSSSGSDDGGFISDALRKTRSSLVRTGARTGASIVDAVRVVSGAVRRALPN